MRELRGGRGLAGALQSREQDDGRRLHGEIERRGGAAHQRGELAMDDADQRLPGRQRADDFLADRLVLDRRDEVLDDRQRDVGFEQREAHLAQRVLDVVVGEPCLAAQPFDDVRQPLR